MDATYNDCLSYTNYFHSQYSRLPITRTFKGNRKKVRVIGSSKKIANSDLLKGTSLHKLDCSPCISPARAGVLSSKRIFSVLVKIRPNVYSTSFIRSFCVINEKNINKFTNFIERKNSPARAWQLCWAGVINHADDFAWIGLEVLWCLRIYLWIFHSLIYLIGEFFVSFRVVDMLNYRVRFPNNPTRLLCMHPLYSYQLFLWNSILPHA